MALSYQAETSDGTLKRVILGIEFFDTSDIYVTQGDTPLSTPADYQWDGRTAINLTKVVPAGVLLMVRRRTVNSETRLKFSQGAPFVRENIDAQNKQFLFLAQEASEGAFGDLYNNLNMHNFRIFNLAEPVGEYDAVTKGWAVRTFSGIYSEYLELCRREADRAVAAASRATVDASIAKTSADTSSVNAAQTATDSATAVAAKEVAERKAVEAAASAATASDAAVRAENAAGTITGAVLDGGECDLSGGVYPKPLSVAGEVYSTLWYVQIGGTVEGIVYITGDKVQYTTADGGRYFRLESQDGVVSVQGKKGAVTLTPEDVKADPVGTANAVMQQHKNAAGAHTPANVGADPAGTAWEVVQQHSYGAKVHSISGVTGLQEALDQKYSATNIVGTVSQSGGVPTGAIIQRGANANGEYVRYADGTQICWGMQSSPNISTAASGNIFTSSVGDILFPVEFALPPEISCTPVTTGGLGVVFVAFLASASPVISTTGVTGLRLGFSRAEDRGVIRVQAIGRWY